MEDFSYNVKVRESILMGYFTRHLQRLVKLWHRRKSGKLILLRNCESRVYLQCSEILFKFMFSKKAYGGLAAKKFTKIYLRLRVFAKCLK